MKNWIRVIVFNILLFIVLCVALEWGSRVVLKRVYNRSFDHALLVDSVFGSSTGMKANYRTTIWGKPFRTNAQGCRENGVAPGQNKKKWLYVGDSVTQGVGVDDSATFTALCARQYPKFGVLNYSLIGYSVSDYFNVLSAVVPEDTSVELVTVFYCLNDVYGSVPSSKLPAMSRQGALANTASWLQERSGLFRLLKLWLFRNANRYFQYDRNFYETENERFRETVGLLQRCDSLCRSHGVYLNVVLLPYRSQVSGPDEQDRMPQERLSAACGKLQIKVVDATPFLQQQPDKGGFYLFADEIHFSAEGHRALARFLTE